MYTPPSRSLALYPSSSARNIVPSPVSTPHISRLPPSQSPSLLLPPSKPLPCPTPSSAATQPPRPLAGRTHGENSPSLCPTIWSEITTSWYTLPLCTWKMSPTMLGRMLAERACVRIGVTFWPGRTLTIGRLCGVSGRSGGVRRRGRGAGGAYGTMCGPGGGG